MRLMIEIKNSIKVAISIAFEYQGVFDILADPYPLFGTITLINKSDLQFESRTPENVWSRSGKRFYCTRASRTRALVKGLLKDKGPLAGREHPTNAVSKRPCSFRDNPLAHSLLTCRHLSKHMCTFVHLQWLNFLPLIDLI